MKVIDNKKYFELAELKKMLKQKSWKDSWNVETIYVDSFIEFLEKIEIIEEDKPIEKITIDLNYANHYSKANVKANGKYLAEKINELIDVVNELKESRGNE